METEENGWPLLGGRTRKFPRVASLPGDHTGSAKGFMLMFHSKAFCLEQFTTIQYHTGDDVSRGEGKFYQTQKQSWGKQSEDRHPKAICSVLSTLQKELLGILRRFRPLGGLLGGGGLPSRNSPRGQCEQVERG